MLQRLDTDDRQMPPLEDMQVLVTAEEAYPAMERAFLNAQTEICASYRVFDLFTKLRSDAARAIGDTWFDLIVHVLNRGVAIRMVLSDFDPILAPGLHCASWKARRAFIAAKEVAGPDAKLQVDNASHSARVGWVPRLLLWPRLIREVAREARKLNAATSDERAQRLERSPGLRQLLHEKPGGTLSAKNFPPPPLIPGTHHQKIAVFDRDTLCIGGLDLNERRYDDTDHRRRRDKTWYDVQLMCKGPVVAEAQRHLESFLDVVAGHSDPPETKTLLRTLSRCRKVALPFLGPRPLVSELAQAHHDAIPKARDLIYLETQFFRDRQIADALAKAGTRHKDLRLVMVLPGAPEDVAFDGNTGSDARFGEYLQATCVDKVQDAFGDRALFCSPVRPVRSKGRGRDTLCGSPIIYVHAKVSIFDTDLGIVSSANLNSRSLYWDTEAGVAITGDTHVQDLRQNTFRHWLGGDNGGASFDTWTTTARQNAQVAPEARTGFVVPYDPVPARAFGRWLPGLPDALV